MKRARSLLPFPIEAGRGLVEQQQARLHSPRPGEADHFLDAEGENRHPLLAGALQLDEVEDLLDHPALGDLLAPHRATAWGASVVMSRPAKKMRPSLGR